MKEKGQTTSLKERVEIGEGWEAGQTDRQIALALGRPVVTVRKWRRRHQRQGRKGLISHMGHPKQGVLGQFPKEMVSAILEMRQAHPGWGPLTLQIELHKDFRFAEKPLPSRSSLAAYLKSNNLVKHYEPQRALPEPKAQPLTRPHQEWEADAQGKITVEGLGRVAIINISDVVSHLKIASLPSSHALHVNTSDYQVILRQAFCQYGLPEQISLDHDTVFFDSQTNSPFPTLLHLWLIGLGVGVRFIQKPPPQEHARVERMHQLMTQQAVRGQSFDTLTQLQAQLAERRQFLNQDYPSRTLGGQAPLQVFPQSAISLRPYRPEWETQILDMLRIYAYLAQGRWFRQTTANGNFSLGAQRYNARIPFTQQTLEITFDAHSQELICLPDDANRVFRLPVKGLTKEILMGELDPLFSFSAYQLSLPFSRQACREIALCEILSGTTL